MGTTSLTLARPQALAERADIRDLLSAWHAALDLRVSSGEMSDATRATYRAGMDRFVAWLDAHGAAEVSADTLREWLAGLRRKSFKPGAINTWLAGVRAFFAWGVGMYHLPYNPCEGVRGAQRIGTSRKHKRAALTDAEVRRVLALPSDDDAGQRDKSILAAMLYTAARTIELHRAELSDLRTEAGRLVLDVQGKGRGESDDVIVFAHPDAESAMHDWLAARGDKSGALFVSLSRRSSGARLSLRAMRGIVKGYLRAAGVRGEGKTTHSLRHTAITSAVKHGAPVQKAQAMARHANISTTMIYYHETDRVENPAEAFIDYSKG